MLSLQMGEVLQMTVLWSDKLHPLKKESYCLMLVKSKKKLSGLEKSHATSRWPIVFSNFPQEHIST